MPRLDTRIAAPAESFPRLMVSAHSDRVVAYPLEAATLNGSSYVFVEPGAAAIERVVFTLTRGLKKLNGRRTARRLSISVARRRRGRPDLWIHRP